MKKWEFNVADVHGLKSFKIDIDDRIKSKVQNNTELQNLMNMAWAIYVRNAPPFLTIPVPEDWGLKEIIIHKRDGKIHIF